MCQSRGIACTPTFLDPLKPRKRRFPERELLDRIRKYETLLTIAGIDKDASHPTELSSVSFRAADSSKRSRKKSRHSSADSSVSFDSHRADLRGLPAVSTGEAPPISPRAAIIDSNIGDLESILETVPDLSTQPSRTPGHPDSAPFSSYLCTARAVFDDVFNQSVQASGASALDTAVSSTLVIHKHLDLMFPQDGSKYFNLDDHCPGQPLIHPEPSLMFRLLHIYEQNIHALIKVVHIPTVRERFCDISAHPDSAMPHDHAVLFAIYTISIGTLTPDECNRLFGEQKAKAVWEKYRRNTQTALCRVGLWRSSHIGAIQAYILYLLTLTKDVDPRAYGICSGNAGRMIQRLLSLYNKRTTNSSATPPIKAVDQELGIRLWWEILACDMRACEKSGISSNPTLATATTVLPRNASDADLGQLIATTGLAPQASLELPNTECLFLLLRCEIAQFQLHPPWSQQHPEHHLRTHLFRSSVFYKQLIESNGRSNNTSSLAWRLSAVDAFGSYIAKRYFGCLEATSSTLLQYAQHHARMWVEKIRLFVHLSQRHVEYDGDIIRICTAQVEEAAKLLGSDRFVCFQWYTYQQLPFFSFVVLLDLLRRHTVGPLVDSAWSAIESSSVIWRPDISAKNAENAKNDKNKDNEAANSTCTLQSGTPGSRSSTKNIYAEWSDEKDHNRLQVRGTMLAALMVAAWDKRSQALAASQPGSVEEPAIVAAMREAAAMHNLLPSSSSATASQGKSGAAASGQRTPPHVDRGVNDGPQDEAQWTEAAGDLGAFTAFLDPSLGTTGSALDDMLNLNSLLQSSVDLDWSGWFNQSWGSTPGANAQTSPANFIPSL